MIHYCMMIIIVNWRFFFEFVNKVLIVVKLLLLLLLLLLFMGDTANSYWCQNILCEDHSYIFIFNPSNCLLFDTLFCFSIFWMFSLLHLVRKKFILLYLFISLGRYNCSWKKIR